MKLNRKHRMGGVRPKRRHPMPDSIPEPKSAEDLARGLFRAADIKLARKLAEGDKGNRPE